MVDRKRAGTLGGEAGGPAARGLLGFICISFSISVVHL